MYETTVCNILQKFSHMHSLCTIPFDGCIFVTDCMLIVITSRHFKLGFFETTKLHITMNFDYIWTTHTFFQMERLYLQLLVLQKNLEEQVMQWIMSWGERERQHWLDGRIECKVLDDDDTIVVKVFFDWMKTG